MSLSGAELEKLFVLLEHIDVKQSYSVLLRLKEIPPEDCDTVREAICAFNALDANSIEVYEFFKRIKNQFSQEDWEALLDV